MLGAGEMGVNGRGVSIIGVDCAPPASNQGLEGDAVQYGSSVRKSSGEQ
jgi:hypothetical protein